MLFIKPTRHLMYPYINSIYLLTALYWMSIWYIFFSYNPKFYERKPDEGPEIRKDVMSVLNLILL